MRQKRARFLRQITEKMLDVSVKTRKDKQVLKSGEIQYVARSTYRRSKKEYSRLSSKDKFRAVESLKERYD